MGENISDQNAQLRAFSALNLPNPAELPADHFGLLKKTLSEYLEPEEIAACERAYLFAAAFHKEQRRRSGEAYINHPVEVALILAKELRADAAVVQAALLHDTVEDTPATKGELEKLFGMPVAELVDGVTKLTNIDVTSMDAKQALNLRKMFLAINKDIRVVLIKLADRLHNMRTLAALPADRRLFKAQETMQVYAPLSDRLGISSIKWELEDLAFSYLEPKEYQRIARLVQESRAQRIEHTEQTIQELEGELEQAGLSDFQITGRPKHLWSIYQKMSKKDKDFSDIYDLIALRVICNTLQECYSILGAVHSLWHPIPGRFKDYIATPKPNFYRSIHTTVIGPDARPVEIQIRTKEMHEQAEYGIAAHWLYKSAGNSEGVMANDDKGVDSRISYIRRSIEWALDAGIDDPSAFLSELSLDLYAEEIFLFTPKGEVLSLRKDSTPLDFAYAIHTEVGNHCVGAKVNGAVVPLNSTLHMGDRVEIMTNKNAHPSPDWLNIVRTPSARSKIRRFFATANKDVNAEFGRSELGKELKTHGYSIANKKTLKVLEGVAGDLQYRDVESLFAAIGSGKASVEQVTHRVDAAFGKDEEKKDARAAEAAEFKQKMETNQPFMSTHAPHTAFQKKKAGNVGVVVKGDPNMLVHLARCCNPVAGDEIVGFVTRGRGISVHRKNCPNVKDLENQKDRMIEVAWDTSGATEFQVEIAVEATDRIGLLRDVTAALEAAKANILSAATQVASTGSARLRFLVSIRDVSALDAVLARVGRVPSVVRARRIVPGEGGEKMKRRVKK